MILELKDTLLVTQQGLLNKEYNLWIGYSYGNKWFTVENITNLINFGLAHTKESLLIWIPSRLYATNSKYIENKGRAESLRLAFELGDTHRKEIEKIVVNLPQESQGKIIVANYDEVLTQKFLVQRELLMREFSLGERFYKIVIDVSKDILEARGRTVSKDRLESVALYVLQELPLFLGGVSKIDSDIIHTVVIYPGLGKLDYLVKSIKTDEDFKLLRQNLKITTITGIADVR